jgi:hypothetical protein
MLAPSHSARQAEFIQLIEDWPAIQARVRLLTPQAHAGNADDQDNTAGTAVPMLIE